MKLYYVYILKCADDFFYTGITNNIDRRIIEHNSNQKIFTYTFKRKPVVLVWIKQFTNPEEAISKEKQIKGWSRKKKIALINENWTDLVNLSKNYSDNKESSKGSD